MFNLSKESVIELRDKAINKLRAIKISELLGTITFTKKEIASYEKDITNKELTINKLKYNASLLDPQSPTFEEETKLLNKQIELENKELNLIKLQTKIDVDGLKDSLQTFENEIERWITGDLKLKIEDINDLTKELILKA
jgi:hypothetical protein